MPNTKESKTRSPKSDKSDSKESNIGNFSYGSEVDKMETKLRDQKKSKQKEKK